MASSASVIAKRLNKETFLNSSEFAKVLEEYFADSESDDSDVDNGEHGANKAEKQMETEELDEDPVDEDVDEDDVPLIITDVDFMVKSEEGDFSDNAGKLHTVHKTFTCTCKLNSGEPCSLIFTPVEIHELRTHCQSLSRDELDLTILSQIQAGISVKQLLAEVFRMTFQ